MTVRQWRFLWSGGALLFFAVVVVTGATIATVLLSIGALVALFWAFMYVRQFYGTDIKEDIRTFGPLIATVDGVWIIFGLIFGADHDPRWLLIVIPALVLRGVLVKRRARHREPPDQPPAG